MSIKKSPIIENLRKIQMIELLSKEKRLDGRSLTDFRPITIKVGVIQKSNGSAEVSIGNTKVVAGVKVETGTPFPDTPNQGLLVVNAEFLPFSSALIEPGPPDEDAIEVSRVVDRGIRESQMIDLNALVIEPGKLVYCVFVDISILNMDGNIFDAAFLSAVSALLTTSFEKKVVKEDGNIAVQICKLPTRCIPISVTSIIIGDSILVDPTEEEESVQDSRLTLTFNDYGYLCAGQKGGSMGMSREQLFKIVDISKAKAEELRIFVKKVIENAQV
ncbi:MAG: exosome complex protein Rrp42 [Nitrososphaeria archaeon]